MPKGEDDKRIASREFIMLVLLDQQDLTYAAPVQVPTLTPEGAILLNYLP